MLSLTTTLPTWTPLPRKNFCLFNSFGYRMPQRWTSFKRPSARVPAWLTITFAAHHSSSKVYILQSTAVTYGQCLATVKSAGIAQRFPYLVLLHLDCLISSCTRFLWLRKRTMVFDTYKSPVIYTRPLEMQAVVFPAVDYAVCLTRRLSFNQEKLTPANVATDICPALSYRSAPPWREWPGCCMLKTTLWFLQCLEH